MAPRYLTCHLIAIVGGLRKFLENSYDFALIFEQQLNLKMNTP